MEKAMKKEKVIKLLEHLNDIDGEIEILKGFLKSTEQIYDTSTGINYDGMPHGKNHISRPTEDRALEIPDFVRMEIKEHNEEIAKLQRLKVEIEKEVLRLKLKQKQVIVYFYFNKMRWGQIGDIMHYSERQCKNIRDEAVNNLTRGFGNNKYIASYEIKE